MNNQDETVGGILTSLVYAVSPDDDGHSQYDDQNNQADAEVEAIDRAAKALARLHKQQMLDVVGQDEIIDYQLDSDWALVANAIRENGAKPYHYKSIRNEHRDYLRQRINDLYKEVE